MKTKNDPHRRTDEGLEVGSGGRIRTYDLWVLTPMFEPPAVITLLPAD